MKPKPKPYLEHDPFEQPRHTCRVCGRQRYEKYMRPMLTHAGKLAPGWYCDKDGERCWTVDPR